MNMQARKRPAATGLNQNTSNAAHFTPTTSPVQVLLSRLDGVQQAGQGWRARCPACGGNSRKVSISEGHDARVLVHCFGGCPALNVVQAVGLELADLYVRRDLRTLSPAEQSAMRQAAKIPNWKAALDMLALEGRVVQIAASWIAAGIVLDDEQTDRLDLAANRISEAREVLQ